MDVRFILLYMIYLEGALRARRFLAKRIKQRRDRKKKHVSANVEVGAEGDLAASLEDAEKLATYKAELHKSCDFLMKNFDLRQGAITAEIEGRLTFRSCFFLTS